MPEKWKKYATKFSTIFYLFTQKDDVLPSGSYFDLTNVLNLKEKVANPIRKEKKTSPVIKKNVKKEVVTPKRKLNVSAPFHEVWHLQKKKPSKSWDEEKSTKDTFSSWKIKCQPAKNLFFQGSTNKGTALLVYWLQMRLHPCTKMAKWNEIFFSASRLVSFPRQ